MFRNGALSGEPGKVIAGHRPEPVNADPAAVVATQPNAATGSGQTGWKARQANGIEREGIVLTSLAELSAHILDHAGLHGCDSVGGQAGGSRPKRAEAGFRQVVRHGT